MKACVCKGRGGEADASSLPGSLLKCTDQSDFPICLANEMMTYGGNVNSFDEASFFNAVKWVGGRYMCVSVCLCGSCCQLARCYFSSSPHLAEILFVCVCVCGCTHRIAVSFWINLVDPFKRSCGWFILSLWGYRDHPTLVRCFPRGLPLSPASPNTEVLHIHCIAHMIDIHHTSATVYPSMQLAAKSRIRSVYISALWSIYKSSLSWGW